jgi:phosphoribosylformylglycinamidine cyclo-ligase
MEYKAADYEKREEIAIDEGKKALKRAPWLHNRTNSKAKGFFFELKENDAIHPNHYAVHCVDGIGTKIFLSAWAGNYRLQPIDAIAMNANDMATAIHAYPDAVDLYFAVQGEVEEQHMGEIMNGFVDALERIRIPDAPFDVNIGKIETASLDEMISSPVKGKGWDVGVVMTGYIEKDKVPNLDPKPGHYIVGVSSTGLHSNGYTHARHKLLKQDVEYREEWKSQYKGHFELDSDPVSLEGKTILEALQTPTTLYLVEAALIGQKFDNRDIYGVNITGNGLKNFNRVGKNVAFEINNPFEALPIHYLLMTESIWSYEKAYTKHNMGMGFAYVAPTEELATEIVDFINERGEHKAKIVGKVIESDRDELTTILHEPTSKKIIEFEGYTN